MLNFSTPRYSWFFKKYAYSLGIDPFKYGRFPTMYAAINLYLQRGGGVILETGCQREIDDWSAGCSTQIFSNVQAHYQLKESSLISVDINKDALKIASQVVAPGCNSLLVESDSVEYLQKYQGEHISLLYLDSFDFPYGPILEHFGGKLDLNQALITAGEASTEYILKHFSKDILPCQEHCLKEIQAASKHLTKQSIVMIDDASLPADGKARLAKYWLRDNDWHIVLDGYQSLWIHK